MNNLYKAKQLIDISNKIAVITGAGISTYSGIPDFRSSNGIYTSYPEEVFSLKEFNRHPNILLNILKEIFKEDYKPNKIHYLLSELEAQKDLTIITQNIDMLHEKALSLNVINIHGTIEYGTCMNCGKKYLLNWQDNINFKCNYCFDNCFNTIKPNIVLYGEDVRFIDLAIKTINETDLLIIMGTSFKVYPVKGLIDYLKLNTPIIVFNNDFININKDNVINISGDILSNLEKTLDL